MQICQSHECGGIYFSPLKLGVDQTRRHQVSKMDFLDLGFIRLAMMQPLVDTGIKQRDVASKHLKAKSILVQGDLKTRPKGQGMIH